MNLRYKEFELLSLLLGKAGQVISRAEILDQVWGIDWLGDTRTLDVHIRWLREKIEDDPSQPRYVQTVRGVGYRFAPPEEFTPMNWRERLFSLQGRLILTYLGLIVIGFGGVALLAGQQLTQGAVDDFTSNLRGQAIIVSSALAEPIEHFARRVRSAKLAWPGGSSNTLEATNTRITLLDP